MLLLKKSTEHLWLILLNPAWGKQADRFHRAVNVSFYFALFVFKLLSLRERITQEGWGELVVRAIGCLNCFRDWKHTNSKLISWGYEYIFSAAKYINLRLNIDNSSIYLGLNSDTRIFRFTITVNTVRFLIIIDCISPYYFLVTNFSFWFDLLFIEICNELYFWFFFLFFFYLSNRLSKYIQFLKICFTDTDLPPWASLSI